MLGRDLSGKVSKKFIDVQNTISAFWLVKNMSGNPKSVQKSEIECKKVKLSAKKYNWVRNGEIENDRQLLLWLSSDKQSGGQKLNKDWNS